MRPSQERTEDVEPKPYSDEELERVRMVLGSSPDMSDSIGDRMLVTLDNLRKHRDGLAELVTHLQAELDTLRQDRDELRRFYDQSMAQAAYLEEELREGVE